MGRDLDQSLWPRGRAFELSCCPGVGIFEFLFVPMTIDHFTGWGISVIFDLTFLPGGRKFYSNFWENVKILPYANPPPPPPPRRFDINRCINCFAISVRLLQFLFLCLYFTSRG